MAIPPIITSNPLLKLFKTDHKVAAEDAAPKPVEQKDIVEISEAAQKRLNGIRELASDDEAQATARATRDLLEKSVSTLGPSV